MQIQSAHHDSHAPLTLARLLEDTAPHALVTNDGAASADTAGAQVEVIAWRDCDGRLPALAAARAPGQLRVLTLDGEPGAPAAFMSGLARQGLFASTPAATFAVEGGEARLHTLEWRDYTIRPAAESDLARLCQLEELCWQHTRMSRQRLKARVRGYPEGQLVVEKDSRVLAALYSQRIEDVERIARHTAHTVHKLHCAGGATVQLLALNVDPAAQDQGLGDQLLEFALQLCAVLPGVEKVVGVTLTKGFDAAGPLAYEDYLRLDGPGQDPVLAFHRAHGAAVVGPVPGYRPEDGANLTHGALVAYDIRHRAAARPEGGGTSSDPAAVERHVLDIARRLLGSEPDPQRPLMEMGLDSADLLQFQLQLEQAYGLRLPGAFFFKYNTLDKVIGHVGHVGHPGRRNDRAPAQAAPAMGPGAGDIAIVGMACRLPGGIETPDALWQLLAQGGSAIGTYPAERGAWPSGAHYPGIDRGGFLADGARFDAAFFRISPSEAEVTDPQQRILLELAWTCLEDAGMPAAALKGSQAGVFVGASNADYSRVVQESRSGAEAHDAIGGSLAILANRLSYFFDLSGPSMLIDTACSSSLVALHCAVAALRAGECPLALVGGVNFICHPGLSVAYHKAGMLAPDASCKVFDAAANGYVRAEGGVVLLLKPAARALADGDRIHALIRGSAVNHGGLAGGLTVPNPDKQRELIGAAWRNAGVVPSDLTYIEAHGTGTSLGDPIEVDGIRQAYGAQGKGCALGSVKSNLGHLESAAGLAGLLKVVLAMRQRMLPPSINFSRLNPAIHLDGAPLEVLRELRPWEGPRIAGVSSFGSGGANAHVVVQEYIDPRAPLAERGGEQVFVLSAASEERLRVYAAAVADWLGGPGAAQSFDAMIYSWQTGRTALRCRLALLAANAADLRAQLAQWLRDPAALARPPAGTPAARWLAGETVDWDELHGEARPRRIGLPTYPFGGERHWIGGAAEPVAQLLAVPRWVAAAPGAPTVPAARHLILCDLDHPAIDADLRLSRRDGETTGACYRRYALACFELVRALLAARPGAPLLLQVAVPDDGEGGLLAGLDGLLRTAAQENPLLTGQLVLVPPALDGAALAAMLDEESGQGGGMVRRAAGQRQVRAWQPLDGLDGLPAAQSPYREDGVYLITGGMGGLGRLFARHILHTCPRARLILTGRAPSARLDELGCLGDVEYRQLDLGDPAAVKALVGAILARHGRLNGVIHAAGMIADSYLLNKTAAEFTQVLAPKVDGLLHLDAACAGVDLDWMALFSSFASALGNAGQADYAAANGFMDQFAAGRAQRSESPIVSINWPLWAEGGMSVDPSALALLRQTTGMTPMQSSTGLAMFERALAAGVSQALVLEGDRAAIHRAIQGAARTAVAAPATPAGAAGDLAAATLERLTTLFAEVMGLAPAGIDSGEAMSAYGIDSIFINKLNAKLAALFGGVSRTLFFEYATLAQLSAYLGAAYPRECAAWCGLDASVSAAPAPLGAAPAPARGAALAAGRQQPIAIIGISGIYPQAPTLDAFWANLRDGRNSVSEIGRWPLDDFYHPDPETAVEQGKSYSKWGGFIEQFADFDPLFFNMSPREALNIDPQERLFLQEAWRAMENAGYTRAALKHKHRQRVGVFAGITKAGYNLYAAQAGERQFFPFTSFSSAANRVSYYFDITGPSMPIDTMCSSSLTAIHEACEHIHRGDCELAFAGGVNLYLHPSSYTWLSSQQMLSRDGLCKSFGAGGNGYVPGEGVGVVLLKPLDRALADGDHIHGVIIGTHVNHGGKANAYTVPSPRAQAELVRHTLDKAGIRATDVSYVEAHGTGTELGDPIEMTGLQQAFAPDGGTGQYCKIGSAKSNIGHLESAAGIAGLSKVLLQMRHRQLAPSLHAAQLNPNIDFSRTAFAVNRQLAPWEPVHGGPRIAGISSFGAGGANAHILVREHVAAPRAAGAGPVIVPLSARTAAQLQQRVRDLLQALDGLDAARDLHALAWTLQSGREAMDERLAVVTDSFTDLTLKLEAFLAGAREGAGIACGQVRGSKRRVESTAAAVEQALARRALDELAGLWTGGAEPDWERLYAHAPGKVPLPGYPFAATRYWIDGALAQPHADVLHPLLHRNASDLSGQRYTSRFSGSEFFLNDHRVRGAKVLPAVAYLEMARAALEWATPPASRAGAIELRDVVWSRPLTVDGAADVGISLRPGEGGAVGFEVASGGASHCQGQAAYGAAQAPHLDLAAVRGRMSGVPLDPAVLYRRFAAMGIAYGPAHRALTAIQCGAGEVLAQLTLPASAAAPGYVIHPATLDCALQASLALLDQTGESRPLMPFAVERLRVHAACGAEMLAWVRTGAASGATVKFDVALCTPDGRVCIEVEGFSSRPMEAGKEAEGELHALAPVWNAVTPAPLAVPAGSRVLLVGGDTGQLAWLRACHPQAQLLELPQAASVADIEARLAGAPFDHLLWIAPEEEGDIVARQEQGVVTVFRIAKALLALGYADRLLRWTLLTAGTQQVRPHDAVAPAHAAVHGLIGSLAKEHPQWQLTLLDIEERADVRARACLCMPADPQGEALAWRGGEWFRQGLARIAAMPAAEPAYRQGGVYVVIGGAGGIGQAWSRFMAAQYGAQLVWIGRQPAGAEIAAKIAAIAAVGPAPLYLQADATDLASLQGAYDALAQRCGRVHGVVHAAIVLADQSVARMDEATFRRALAAKVDVSVHLDQVFGGCDLDFLLYFSSLIVFTKAAGQSNYAAGSTFKDSFALGQARRRAYPVKIMNWGYWGSVGIVTSEFYNKRMQQRGIGSIQPDEAMAALQDLVGSPLRQIALMKTLERRAVDEITLADSVSIFPRAGGESEPGPLLDGPPSALAAHLLPQEMVDLAGQLLAAMLAPGPVVANPLLRRWLASSLDYLRVQGITAATPLAQLWTAWDARRAVWEADADLRAQCRLLDACLKALPEILSGQRLATDVMFPDSSLGLVEGVYRNNALSDYYNAALGATLAARIRARLDEAPGAAIRILEIGAGTGGTTTALLPLLAPFGAAIAEYCYTDLSKAFLMHAEEQFKPRLPSLRTALFDVSRPLAGQGMPAGHFDFVVATNVLHATPNIRTTLRNAKAALKHHGVLLLNEMSVWSLFNHLTFGLLDGWWLYEDEALRLPGSPGLAPAKWGEVLAELGFEQVWFAVEQAHALGQQVIGAVSDGIVRQAAPQPVPASASAPTPISAPLAIPPHTAGATLRAQATAHVQGLVAATLRIETAELEPDRPLADYGLDSILVVGLTSQLRKAFAGITSTLLFEVESIAGLVEHLMERNQDELSRLLNVAPAAPAPQPAAPAGVPAPAAPAGRFDVAIVGLAGRYPGAANLAEFWNNLAAGRNCITEIPAERWDADAWFDPEKGKAGKMYTRHGGFLDDIDKFDPLFFKLSPKEAKAMDPQERLFLETCYHAIEDAGYTPATLGASDRLGVFAGVMNARYTTQPLHYSIANRVSYLLNFQGPSMAVDTACSASLTAVHLALESLYSGSSECAIAGGVNLIIDPVHYLELSALTMLSSGDKCRSFGAQADGFVDAEGVGAVVLKPLAHAERDGDHVYAVIKGSAVNAGGRTNGYTVPNPKAQAAVVRQALERAGLTARQVGYIEAHGTGTALGDPIEVAGLASAFAGAGAGPQDGQFCALGSVKSNIGHCESAAGIAGLTKVLLQLKHGQLAPSLHAEPGNPEIDFASTPFRVQHALGEWPRARRMVDGQLVAAPRVAGISSFGAGGANAHLIVQEYAAPVRAGITGPAAVILSARTADQLRHKAADLLAFAEAEAPDLGALAFTLQVGREDLEERAGLLVHSLAELRAKLAAFLDGTRMEGMWTGKVNRHRQDSALPLSDPAFQAALEQRVARADLATLLDWWTQGARPAWERLYGAHRPGRISLPLYPFARERCWRPLPQTMQLDRPQSLHPLLHANVSTVRQQRYATPSGALGMAVTAPLLLEMARAAVMDGAFRDRAGAVLTFEQVAFGDLAAAPGETIAVALFERGDTRVDVEIYGEESDQVYCQAHALLGAAAIPPLPVDGAPLAVRLPADGEADGMDLHPALLEAALRTAGAGALAGIDMVRMLRPCGREMAALVRHGATGLDMDLHDGHGEACVQLRGIRCEAEAPPARAAISLHLPDQGKPAAAAEGAGAPVNAEQRQKVSLVAPA